MKIHAEKKGEKDIILTIRDDLNVTMQVKYDDLRKEVNKAIEELFPKIK